MRNQTQDPTQPPRYGYRSYAEMIKQYLIYGRFYAGWHKNQSKFCFRVIYAPIPNDDNNRWSYHRQPIGYEMVWREDTRRREASDRWVLRCYVDGTALIRRSELYSMRQPAVSAINSVINFFYYRESYQNDRDTNDSYTRVEVLRRKPLNPYHTAPNASDFGRFLENKYNQQPES